MGKNNDLSFKDFHSEIIENDNLRFYDEVSMENYMAVLSHYLHDPERKYTSDEKITILSALQEFLSHKAEVRDKDTYDIGNLEQYLNEPIQLDLFSDFFNVPLSLIHI